MQERERFNVADVFPSFVAGPVPPNVPRDGTVLMRHLIVNAQKTGLGTGRITTPGGAAELIRRIYRRLGFPVNMDCEVFIVLFLDDSVVTGFRYWIGAERSCLVPIRQIITTALVSGATGILCAHSHPLAFGELVPSVLDHAVTAALTRACDCVWLKFHEHLLVDMGGDGFVRIPAPE